MSRDLVASSILIAALTATGCGHYRSSLPLERSWAPQVRGDLAVAGIIDHRSRDAATPAFLPEPTSELRERIRAADVSAVVNGRDVALILGSPADLVAHPDELQDLRQRIGHRYVVAGAQGADVVSHMTFWNMLFVVPMPYVWVAFSVPVRVSQEDGVPHGTRLVRIVDLDEGAIVAESYELLRGRHDGEFSDGQVRDAVKVMQLHAK